jgi:hypothetical protein
LCGPCVAMTAPAPRVPSVLVTKLRRVGMDHPP